MTIFAVIIWFWRYVVAKAVKLLHRGPRVVDRKTDSAGDWGRGRWLNYYLI